MSHKNFKVENVNGLLVIDKTAQTSEPAQSSEPAQKSSELYNLAEMSQDEKKALMKKLASQGVKARDSWFPYGQFLADVAAKLGLTDKQVDVVLKATIAKMTELLCKGEKVILPTLGCLVGRTCHNREMTNLRTGAKFQTGDRQRVKFEASSVLNELLDKSNPRVFKADEPAKTDEPAKQRD